MQVFTDSRIWTMTKYRKDDNFSCYVKNEKGILLIWATSETYA